VTNVAVPKRLIEGVEALVNGHVTRAVVLEGGRSRNVYSMDVESAEGKLPIVVRQESGAGPQTGTRFTLQREAAVLGAVPRSAGLAPVFYGLIENGTAIVMERLRGTAKMPPSGAARLQLIRSFTAQLAALHELPLDMQTPFELTQDSRASGLADLADYEDAYRRLCVQHAVIDDGIAWLHRNVPDPLPRTVLVHGDAGPGNFMHENSEVTGLIDWEMTHAGDPHDDLAWIWFRVSLLKQDVEVDSYFDSYVERSGLAVDAGRLLYFIVQILFRCSVMCGVRQHHDPAHDDSRARQLRELLAAGLHDAAAGRMSKLPPLPRVAGGA
jgi:aminoglycoside phosphotransferase (APT) family kinase protein